MNTDVLSRPIQDFRYRTDTSSQSPNDPGGGKIKWNTAGQLDATELYVDWQDEGGFDIQTYLQRAGVTSIIIQETGLALNYQEWKTDQPATNMSDWMIIPVTFIGGAKVFANKAAVSIILFSEGVPGPIGPQGEVGPIGPIGSPTPQSITECQQCMFWTLHVSQDDRGHCHRRAPQSSRDQIQTYFPITLRTDWCAEGLLGTPTEPEPEPEAPSVSE